MATYARMGAGWVALGRVLAEAVREFTGEIALAEEQRAREADKEQEALRDVLRRLNRVTVSMPVQKHVESVRPGDSRESLEVEQQTDRLPR